MLVIGKLLLLVLLFLPIKTYALDNVDECKIFKDLVIENKAKLSLDETDWRMKKNFGFDLYEENEGKNDWYISRINPDLYYEYPDYDIEKIQHSYIELINGIKVEKIDETKLEKELEKEKIALKFLDVDDIYTFEKKTYMFFPIFVSTNVKNISAIDSKTSSFEADIQIQTFWANSKLSSIVGEIYKKLTEINHDHRETEFFCELSREFIKKSEIYIPEIVPINSKKTLDRNYEEKLRVDFFPPNRCEDIFDGGCIEDEIKNGTAMFSTDVFYQGIFFQKFNFSKFPFDEQILQIKLKAKERGEYQGYRDITQSEYGESLQKQNLQNFLNNEWDFKNYGYVYDYYFDSLDQINIPYLLLEFDIGRINNYYILKLMLPIVFLIIITWSVFWIIPKDLESRLTVSVVSFLSLIAYNFVVDQDLPKLGYLTFLDNFVLYSYIFAGVPTLQTVLSKYLCDIDKENMSTRLDREFRIYYLPLYFGSIIFLFIYFEILTLN